MHFCGSIGYLITLLSELNTLTCTVSIQITYLHYIIIHHISVYIQEQLRILYQMNTYIFISL